MKNLLFILLFFLTNVSFAQNCNGFEDFPLGKDKAFELYDSLKFYSDNEAYELAQPYFDTLFKYSPAGDVEQFGYGKQVLILSIRNENDEKEKLIYQEKMVNLFETHLTCFSPTAQDSGKVLEHYAMDLSTIEYNDDDKILALYQKAVEMNGNNTGPWILGYYSYHISWMFGFDLVDKATYQQVYKQLENIAKVNEKRSFYSEDWYFAKQYFLDYDIKETFDCSYYEQKLRPLYEQDKYHTASIRKILEKLETECSEETDFKKELRRAVRK